MLYLLILSKFFLCRKQTSGFGQGLFYLTFAKAISANLRRYLHPSTVASDVSFDASSDSSWHVPSPVNRFTDTHHDVSRHVAAHLVAELRVMTSRGATSKRLSVSTYMSVSCRCDVTTLSCSISSTSKQVRIPFTFIKMSNNISMVTSQWIFL